MINSDEFSLECVRPIESHARLIMLWRNDPDTLAASFHSRPKIWESFYPEFISTYFTIPQLTPLFILHNSKRIAFVRFRAVNHPINPTEKCCELSLNVSPDKRGQGLGPKILKVCVDWAQRQGFPAIVADIRQFNQRSIKTFESAGFLKIASGSKQDEETLEEIPFIKLLLDLAPKIVPVRVFIIAEIGSNWRMGTPERDFAMAKTLIKAAANAGANAAKFQVFRPETIYVKNAGSADYLEKEGIHESMEEIYQEHALPYDMIPKLDEYCRQLGIEFMASVFSPTDLDAVNPYVKRHKLASYEIGNIRLIEKIASTGKPVIISTGAATEEDIEWVVDYFYSKGSKDLTLMQCTAAYPSPLSAMHLHTIQHLKERFKLPVGLSDHSTPPAIAPVAAVALGAIIIEKHITLCKNLPSGPDHFFALEPEEFRLMVDAIHCTELMLGQWVKEIVPEEKELHAYAKRGIQALKSIKVGEILHEGKNIAVLRPGRQVKGIHPKHLTKIEGKKAIREISEGEGIQIGDFI